MRRALAGGLLVAACVQLYLGLRPGLDQAPAPPTAPRPSTPAPRRLRSAPPVMDAVGSAPAAATPSPPERSEAPAETRFKVLSDTGEPLAGARVAVFELHGGLRARRTPQIELTTDAFGVARAEQPRSSDWHAEVSLPGFVPAQTPRVLPGSELVTRLARGAEVTLYVRERDGRPSSGPKTVRVLQAVESGWLASVSTAQADGEIVTAVVPVSGKGVIEIAVDAGAGGYVLWRREPWGADAIADTVQLTQGVEFSGFVLDAISGAPLANARVRIASPAATTDAAGAFRLIVNYPLERLTPSARIYADHSDYAPASLPVGGVDPRNVVFSLEAGAKTRIDVTGLGPAETASVIATFWDKKMPYRRVAASRLPDGSFEAHGLSQGRQYYGTVDAPGCAPAPFTFAVGNPCTPSLTVAVRRLVRVRGRVMRAGGGPVAGARCELNLVDSTLVAADGTFKVPGATPKFSVPHEWSVGPAWTTDASGAFQLEAPPGSHHLRVFSNGPDRDFVSVAFTVAESDEPVDVGTLTVR